MKFLFSSSMGIVELFFTVLLSSSLMIAFTNGQQRCLSVDTVDNASFDLATYASKPWYVQQQAENTYTSRDLNRCVKAEYNVRNSRSFWGYRVDVSNVGVRESTGQSQGGNLCADYDEDKPSRLKVAPCFLPSNFAGPYWIVDYKEDNENGYALISGGSPTFVVEGDVSCGITGTEQCCRTGSGINNSGLWIFTRKPNPCPGLVEKVRSIARRKGFSLEVFFDVDQSDCGYDDDNDNYDGNCDTEDEDETIPPQPSGSPSELMSSEPPSEAPSKSCRDVTSKFKIEGVKRKRKCKYVAKQIAKENVDPLEFCNRRVGKKKQKTIFDKCPATCGAC